MCYLSFVEFGCVQLSCDMILYLVEYFDVLLCECNVLLIVVGFVFVFWQCVLDDLVLVIVCYIIDLLLQGLEFYFVFVIDCYWQFVVSNQVIMCLFVGVVLELLQLLINVLWLSLYLVGFVLCICNFVVWCVYLLYCLCQQIDVSYDLELIVLLCELQVLFVLVVDSVEEMMLYGVIVVLMQLEVDGVVFNMFSIIMVFGSFVDIILVELVLEVFVFVDVEMVERLWCMVEM